MDDSRDASPIAGRRSTDVARAVCQFLNQKFEAQPNGSFLFEFSGKKEIVDRFVRVESHWSRVRELC